MVSGVFYPSHILSGVSHLAFTLPLYGFIWPPLVLTFLLHGFCRGPSTPDVSTLCSLARCRLGGGTRERDVEAAGAAEPRLGVWSGAHTTHPLRIAAGPGLNSAARAGLGDVPTPAAGAA